MVYLFVKYWYPSHKNEEVVALGQKVLKENPRDPEVSELVVFSGVPRKDGYEAVAISKVKEGKINQALKRAYNLMMKFAVIEGYEYAVEIWVDLLEAQQD